MLPLLAFAGLGLSLVGRGVQAAAAKQAHAQNARDLEMNAGIARMQAYDAIQQGEIAVSDLRREGRRIQSEQVASFAAQGVDVGEGVAQAVQQDTSEGVARDAARIRDRANKEAWEHIVQADQYQTQAKREKKKGRYAIINGLLGGAGETASSISDNPAKFGIKT